MIVGTILKGMKWDDDVACPVTVRVDKNGFYIYWVCQKGDTGLLDICTIRDTRTGKYAKMPGSAKLRTSINVGANDRLEDKLIQIIYGSEFNNLRELNFSCLNKELAKLWTEELVKLAYNVSAINSCPLTFLKKAHAKLRFMVERGDKLPVKKLTKMFTSNKEERKRIERALELTGLPSSRNDSILIDDFTFDKFLTFYRHLVGRTELEQIFIKLFPDAQPLRDGGWKCIDVDTLVNFVNKYQRDPRLNEILYKYADRERGLEIIRQYEPFKDVAKRDTFSYEGFMRYLMSDDNSIVAPEKLDLHMDMDQPLNHYFINSSHNTYLTGHQLRGKSSVEMYRQCLLSGCRCVELDCWNGKTDEEPIITHGYTVVTEISFKQVLEAINESAFKTSPYPVILSFENHCTPRQQAKMVQYCKEIFSSDVLLTEPLSDYPLDQDAPLPSPNRLMRRIIIKNKKKTLKKRSSQQKSFTPSSATVASCDNDELVDESEPEEDIDIQQQVSQQQLATIDTNSMSGSTTAEMLVAEAPEAEPATEMSALVVYMQPVRFESFEIAERNGKSYEVSSFAETEATRLLKERPVDFVSLNKRQFTRVYPKGTRVDSSNYLPQIYWNAGCQMVALNFQTLDLGMQLNMGMFDYNFRSGYLLKPEFMRRSDRTFDPFTDSTVDGIIAGTVSVKVISGQFLSEKRVGTFVEVEMYGLPADSVRRRRTKVSSANGINPTFDDEPFTFKKVVLPDLASLRIAAFEESGKFIGYRILPVNALRPGYRHLPLRSESNQPLLLPTLFLKIEVNSYVPDPLLELADALANPILHQSLIEKRAKQLEVLNELSDE